MFIDIVFISYNRKKEVEYNINLMSDYNDINKIIWVDNGSSDGVESIAYDREKVLFIPLESNIGIEAYNIGVKHSTSDIIVILDDDSHVYPESLIKVSEYFEKERMLGILAFQIILPSTGEVVTRDWKVGDSTYFWGCGAAIRKSVWDKLGGYNKDLFLYGNEYDLSIRVWNEGYNVVYTPDVIAYHRVSSMNRTSDRLISFSIRNNYRYIKTYFARKHHFRLFFYDRLSWFIRATLSGSPGSFFRGLKMIQEIKGTIKPYPISEEIQKFYIRNQRIFEDPLRKTYRKIKYGSLFKFSKRV